MRCFFVTHLMLFFAVVVQVDGEPIRVELCDTAGEVIHHISLQLFTLFTYSYKTYVLIIGAYIVRERLEVWRVLTSTLSPQSLHLVPTCEMVLEFYSHLKP